MSRAIHSLGYWATMATVASVTLFVAYRLDQPMLIAAFGLAPLAAIVAWSQPFVVCALFVSFAHFRLPEAYPALEGLKPSLLLGSAAVALVATKALLTPLRPGVDERTVKTLSLGSLLICAAVAVPYSAMRSAGMATPDALGIPLALTSAAFCAVAWYTLLSSASARPMPANIRLFTAFFVVICLTSIFGRVPGDSFDYWSSMTWKVAAMTLATVWLARSQRDLSLATALYIASGVLIAFVVFYNKANGISLVEGTRVAIGLVASDDPEVVRASARVLSDPNDLALILMFPLAFALARLVHRSSWINMLASASAATVILLAITFTQSRGAALGVMMVVAVLLFQRYRSFAVGVMAIVIAGPLLISAMSIATRSNSVSDGFSQGDLDNSAQHRIDAWKTAVNMAAARPLTGVGIGNFSQMYYSYTEHWHNRAIAAHSMWFQVLGEIGLIGFALFVGMIWKSFTLNAATIRLLERARAPPGPRAMALGLQAALAGTCAAGTFLSQAYNWPLYMIIAMIAAIASQAAAVPVEDPASELPEVDLRPLQRAH